MPDHDENASDTAAGGFLDLRAPASTTSSVELRSEVDRMAAEIVAATRRIAPLLRDATALLAQVDRMVCDYADTSGPGSVDERYWSAVQSSGHEHLFDALQHLSALADAYVVVHDRHPASPEVAAV